MGTQANEPIAISIAEVVASSPLSRSEVYRALQRGELRAKKLGRRTFIMRDDFAKFLASLPDYPIAA